MRAARCGRKPAARRRSRAARWSPRPWRGFCARPGRALLRARSRRGAGAARCERRHGSGAARRRRVAAASLVALAACWPRCADRAGAARLRRRAALQRRQIALFALLFAWIAAGFVDRADGLLGRCCAATRTRCRAAQVRRTPIDPRRAHRDRHADLQRGRGHGVRRPARDLRIARRHRRTRSCSTSSCCPTATRPTLAAAERAAWEDLRAALAEQPEPAAGRGVLPLAPAPHPAQGRQRGRLLPPLGHGLPLHGGARRRQRDERRLPDHAGAS